MIRLGLDSRPIFEYNYFVELRKQYGLNQIVHRSWLCRRRDLISYYWRKHPCWILVLFNDEADIILLWVPIESTESSIAAPVVPIESTESLIAAPVVPPTIVIRITATGTAIRITIAIVWYWR